MLLERRDFERRINASNFELSRRDKMLLLEDLAYWLIRNGWSDASIDRITERFDQRLSSMPRVSAGGAVVVKFLLDRSGVIRQPAVDRIDFIHRTFQEYLAAGAAVDADDIGVLVEHAHDDQWREVVVMAAGHALLHQRDELLGRLLARAEAEPEYRQIIRVLAVACLETSHQLDSKILADVEAVAAELLPPRTMRDAEALAVGGDFILDLLVNRPIRGARQAAATIRLASLVGGEKALEIISGCASRAGRIVVNELRRAWLRFEPEVYARRVLDGVTIDSMIVTDPALLPVLHYPKIYSLSLNFPRGHGDISNVAQATEVERLQISDRLVRDLSPLAEMPKLRSVDLRVTGLVGLEDFAQNSVVELDFDYRNVGDPASLRSFKALKQLQIVGLRNAAALSDMLSPGLELYRFGLWDAEELEDLDGLLSLRALESLGFLLLSRCFRLRSISGIERWANTLTGMYLVAPSLEDVEKVGALPGIGFLNLHHTPVSDLSFITALAQLEVLHLGGEGPLPDLAPLRGLDRLEYLFLWGNDDVDLTPLAGKDGLTVNLEGFAERRVYGQDKLGKHSRVRRR